MWYDGQSSTYVSCCPALMVYSQGQTVEEACSAISSGVKLFLESCISRGILEEVLHERGIRKINAKG